MSKTIVIPESIEDIYTTMKERFIAQGSLGRDSSVPTGGTCLYLTTDNKRCALGILIPPQSYTDSFEGNGAESVLDQLRSDDPLGYAQVVGLFPTDDTPVKVLSNAERRHRDFITKAQSVHDTSETLDYFLTRLDILAFAFGVEVGFPPENESPYVNTLAAQRAAEQEQAKLQVWDGVTASEPQDTADLPF